MRCQDVKVMVSDSGIVSPNVLAEVRTLLKENPKGMSVSDIAAALGMNRNSTAKYLDILCVGGQIEMKNFGPAKVYFLSQRVPLGAILNYTNEYILILDQHYRILQVNDRYLDYLGKSRPDLLGRSIDAVSLPIVSENEVRSRMLEALSEGEVSLEVEQGRGDSTRYHRVRLVSTVFDDGSTGITCIIEEITERKRAERILQESERRFREIVELSPFPCAIVDPAGRYLYVNSRFTETFGYTAEELGTMDRWFDLAYPDADYRSYMDAAWQREQGDQEPEPRFFHVRTRDGDVREVVFRLKNLSDGNHYLVYEDISEIRRLENALAEHHRLDDALFSSVQRFTDISRASRNLLFTANLEGEITFVSPLLERISGYRNQDCAGRPLSELISSQEIEIGPALYAKIAGGETYEKVEMVVYRSADEGVIIIACLSPSRNETGHVVGLEGILILESGRLVSGIRESRRL
jgi:PAS domain S-box-containing protein